MAIVNNNRGVVGNMISSSTLSDKTTYIPQNKPSAPTTQPAKPVSFGFSPIGGTPVNQTSMGVKAAQPTAAPQNTNTLPDKFKAPDQTNKGNAFTNSSMTTSGQNTNLPQNPNPAITPTNTQTPMQSTPTPAQVPTYSGVVGSLIKTGTEGSQGYTEAVNKLADFRKNVAQQNANIESTPIPIEFQQGRQQVLNRQAAVTDAALQNAVNQQQTQQGQQITALQSAGNFAKPELAQPGQSFYNPITGQSSGGLDEATLNNYARLRASGQESLIPSQISGNAVLNDRVTQAARTMNPQFNANVAGAQAKSAGELTQNASELQAAANSAEANFNLLLNIARAGGVNNMNVPALITLENNVKQGLTSNEAVVNFRAIIQAVRSQYAQILGGGSVTVESLNEAKALVPDNVSLSALTSLGQNLKSDASNRIIGIQNQVKSLTGGATPSQGRSKFSW